MQDLNILGFGKAGASSSKSSTELQGASSRNETI